MHKGANTLAPKFIMYYYILYVYLQCKPIKNIKNYENTPTFKLLKQLNAY